VFRARIDLNTDPDPTFQVNTDSDPDPGFFMMKMKEVFFENNLTIYKSQISKKILITGKYQHLKALVKTIGTSEKWFILFLI